MTCSSPQASHHKPRERRTDTDAGLGTGDQRYGDYLKASPYGMVDLIQPKLEPILVKAAGERGASTSFMSEYLGYDQDADGVTVRLRPDLVRYLPLDQFD